MMLKDHIFIGNKINSYQLPTIKKQLNTWKMTNIRADLAAIFVAAKRYKF